VASILREEAGGCWRWRCTGPTAAGRAGRGPARPLALTDDLGLEPGPRLRRLDDDILQQAGHLNADTPAGQVWSRPSRPTAGRRPWTASPPAIHRRSVAQALAVTGGAGSVAARLQGWQSILAAEELGMPN